MEACFKTQTTKSCKTKRKGDHCIMITDQLSFFKVIHTTAVYSHKHIELPPDRPYLRAQNKYQII